MFKVGQKVVCVKKFEGLSYYTDLPSPGWYPVVGDIYTIENIWTEGTLILKECPESSAFDPSKFKPLKLDYDFVEQVIKKVKKESLEEGKPKYELV